MGRGWLVGALVVASCTTPATYSAQVARVVCDRYQSCDPNELLDVYTDVDGCRSEIERSMRILRNTAQELDCDFEDDEASECLSSIPNSPCVDFEVSDSLDLCSRAYECGTWGS